MSKKMLIDAAHPEEVRVAVVAQKKIEDFDFESAARKPLRGNIFLARVTRVEPSLQAAFVDYGGNRHGFLAFSEIHPDYYQIPVSDRKLLQEAEQEVAELAAKLELAQRGDNDDEEDHDRDDPDRHDDGRRMATHANGADDDDAGIDDESDGGGEDESEIIRADASDDDDDSEGEGEGEEDQSARRRNADEEEEEEEEETDGEDEDDDDDNAAVSEDEPGSEPVESQDGPPRKAEADAEDADENGGETADDADDSDGEVVSDASDDKDDAENDNEADEGAGDGKGSASRNARAARDELLERYKNAKRKRANLLRNYKIQEVIKRRQILLIQVVKEERGNKGAALTTYMSLAGRYCVLMPNTARGGGISRKIANGSDRRRLRRVVDSLEVPRGMGLIIRTAGAKRTKTEIKRDYDYLLRLWENIRSLTLKSIAPCLIYEEASLIKRAIRDLYDKDISKVYVEGEEGYREAKDFMKMLMPSHAKNVQPYKDRAPIFLKHGVEAQLDGMYQPSVRLKSGGYIVIHQTEALVAIDVNSGRATRERNIEQTALRTNIEAAEEAARQFRLRDLAGLIVIDFIDMDEPRNNRKVERALKEAMKTDRARVQVGRISPFGLLELSRQRRRSGIVDGTTQSCPTCAGAGVIRSQNMAAFRILRAIEGEAIAGRVGKIAVRTSIDVAMHVLNHHRDWINRIEEANAVSVEIVADPGKHGDDYELETSGAPRERSSDQQVIRADQTEPIEMEEDVDGAEETREEISADEKPKKRKRRRRSRRDRDEAETRADDAEEKESSDADSAIADAGDDAEGAPKKRRRRGRRGGRRNRKETARTETSDQPDDETSGDKTEAAPETPGAAEAGSDDSAKPVDDDSDDGAAAADVAAPQADETSSEPLAAAPSGPSEESVAAVDQPAEPSPAAAGADKSDEASAKPQKRTRGGWWRRSAS